MARFRAPVTQDLGPDVPTESLCGLWSLEASRVAGGSPKCQSARDAKGAVAAEKISSSGEIHLLQGISIGTFITIWWEWDHIFVPLHASIRACMHTYIQWHTYIHTYHTIPYHTITFQYISVHFSTFHYITLQYSTYTHIMYNIYIIIYQYVHVYTLVYISLSWIPGRQWLRLHRSARGLRGPPRGGRGARGARGHAKGAACREDRDGWALNM